MKKKLAIIFTGGTISMKTDPELHATIPGINSDEVINTIKNIEALADLKIINFGNFPSPHINLKIMMDIFNLTKAQLSQDDISGVVITHGTDTLEETAYLLDLLLDTQKPVILVGSMRNFSELGYDGSSNLSAAICTALCEKSRDRGVLVVMNNEVNSASEVTKTNTLSLDTFKSPDFGPLGIVDNDEVIYSRNKLNRQNFKVNEIEEKVGLIKAVAGLDSSILDFYIDSNYKGIVIEALGRGNIPPEMLPGVKKALQKNIPIVIVSRCPKGRVLYTYGYSGGGKNLRDLGAIFGGNLPGQKARIKLMVLLKVTSNLNELRNLFETNL